MHLHRRNETEKPPDLQSVHQSSHPNRKPGNSRFDCLREENGNFYPDDHQSLPYSKNCGKFGLSNEGGSITIMPEIDAYRDAMTQGTMIAQKSPQRPYVKPRFGIPVTERNRFASTVTLMNMDSEKSCESRTEIEAPVDGSARRRRSTDVTFGEESDVEVHPKGRKWSITNPEVSEIGRSLTLPVQQRQVGSPRPITSQIQHGPNQYGEGTAANISTDDRLRCQLTTYQGHKLRCGPENVLKCMHMVDDGETIGSCSSRGDAEEERNEFFGRHEDRLRNDCCSPSRQLNRGNGFVSGNIFPRDKIYKKKAQPAINQSRVGDVSSTRLEFISKQHGTDRDSPYSTPPLYLDRKGPLYNENARKEQKGNSNMHDALHTQAAASSDGHFMVSPEALSSESFMFNTQSSLFQYSTSPFGPFASGPNEASQGALHKCLPLNEIVIESKEKAIKHRESVSHKAKDQSLEQKVWDSGANKQRKSSPVSRGAADEYLVKSRQRVSECSRFRPAALFEPTGVKIQTHSDRHIAVRGRQRPVSSSRCARSTTRVKENGKTFKRRVAFEKGEGESSTLGALEAHGVSSDVIDKNLRKTTRIIMCTVPATGEAIARPQSPLQSPKRKSIIPRKVPRVAISGFPDKDATVNTLPYWKHVMEEIGVSVDEKYQFTPNEARRMALPEEGRRASNKEKSMKEAFKELMMNGEQERHESPRTTDPINDRKRPNERRSYETQNSLVTSQFEAGGAREEKWSNSSEKKRICERIDSQNDKAVLLTKHFANCVASNGDNWCNDSPDRPPPSTPFTTNQQSVNAVTKRRRSDSNPKFFFASTHEDRSALSTVHPRLCLKSKDVLVNANADQKDTDQIATEKQFFEKVSEHNAPSSRCTLATEQREKECVELTDKSIHDIQQSRTESHVITSNSRRQINMSVQEYLLKWVDAKIQFTNTILVKPRLEELDCNNLGSKRFFWLWPTFKEAITTTSIERKLKAPLLYLFPSTIQQWDIHIDHCEFLDHVCLWLHAFITTIEKKSDDLIQTFSERKKKHAIEEKEIYIKFYGITMKCWIEELFKRISKHLNLKNAALKIASVKRNKDLPQTQKSKCRDKELMAAYRKKVKECRQLVAEYKVKVKLSKKYNLRFKEIQVDPHGYKCLANDLDLSGLTYSIEKEMTQEDAENSTTEREFHPIDDSEASDKKMNTSPKLMLIEHYKDEKAESLNEKEPNDSTKDKNQMIVDLLEFVEQFCFDNMKILTDQEGESRKKYEKLYQKKLSIQSKEKQEMEGENQYVEEQLKIQKQKVMAAAATARVLQKFEAEKGFHSKLNKLRCTGLTECDLQNSICPNCNNLISINGLSNYLYLTDEIGTSIGITDRNSIGTPIRNSIGTPIRNSVGMSYSRRRSSLNERFSQQPLSQRLNLSPVRQSLVIYCSNCQLYVNPSRPHRRSSIDRLGEILSKSASMKNLLSEENDPSTRGRQSSIWEIDQKKTLVASESTPTRRPNQSENDSPVTCQITKSPYKSNNYRCSHMNESSNKENSFPATEQTPNNRMVCRLSHSVAQTVEELNKRRMTVDWIYQKNKSKKSDLSRLIFGSYRKKAVY